MINKRVPNSLVFISAIAVLLSGCMRLQTPQHPDELNPVDSSPLVTQTPDLSAYRLPTRVPGSPLLSPSPDAERVLPPMRSDYTQHIVQYGDTLNAIALYFGVDVNALIEANQPMDPEMLEVGRLLQIPPPVPVQDAPDFKIIPDSELVFSPSSLGFDIAGFIQQRGGYLARYTEEVDNAVLNGAEIVERVSRENSVNPRFLLALLDYQSGWVSSLSPAGETLEYPLRYFHPAYKGLFLQLSQAANELNRGYYLWRINGLSHYVLADGSVVRATPEINAATAGIQLALGRLAGLDAWNRASKRVASIRLISDLFGFPFDYSFEPLLPPGSFPTNHAATIRAGKSLVFHQRSARRLGGWRCLGCPGFCPARQCPGLRAKRGMGYRRCRWFGNSRAGWSGDPGPGWRRVRANRLDGGLHARRIPRPGGTGNDGESRREDRAPFLRRRFFERNACSSCPAL